MSDQDTRFQKAADIMAAPLGENVMIMDTQSGHYYELRDTGRFLWDALEQHSTVDGLAQVLCAEFDVSPELARDDVLNFLADLTSKGLVQRV